MPDSDPSTTLTGIREAAGNENTASVLYGLERMVRKSSDWEGWVSEDYETVAKVIADLGRLRDAAPLLLAAVEKVLELHKPVWDSYVDGDGIERATYECAECEPPGTPDNWPCNTYRAITTALTGKEPDDNH